MREMEPALEGSTGAGLPLLKHMLPLAQPLRNRNYALLFTGQLCSLVGDQLYVVALPFLVLGQATPRDLGFVLMAFGAARIATVPIGGVLADRMSRGRLMLLTDAGRALCVVGVAVVAFMPGKSVWQLMVLTGALGAMEGIFLPSSYAILPDVLNDDHLPAGNALNSMLESGAAFVGPALAGLIVATFTPGVALAIDAFTFVISAGTLMALRPTARSEESEQPEEPESSSGMGFFRLLTVSRVVQFTLLITLFSNLAFDGMTEVALPVYSRDYLARGAQGFGMMLSAFGAGALLGGLLADAFFRIPRRGLVALGVGIMQGTALALVPLAGGLVGATILLGASGLTIGVLNVFYMTNLQQHVPPHLLGRSMGALTMAAFGAQPVSAVAAGLLIGASGPAPIFLTAGLLIVVGYLLALLSSEYRRL